MTGKGDRWGRDRLGRSAPAFLSASTTALPHLPALHGERQADVVCSSCFCCKAGQLLAVCLRPVPGGESAGCVCLQCPVLQAVFCLPCHLCLPCPLPSSVCPRSFASVCFALFISMCARIVERVKTNMFASCKTVLLAAATCLQWRPVRQVHLTFSFSCRVHDPGPWV